MDLAGLDFDGEQLDDLGWRGVFYRKGESGPSSKPFVCVEPCKGSDVVNIPDVCSNGKCPHAKGGDTKAWADVLPRIIDEYDCLEEQYLAGLQEIQRHREHLLTALRAVNGETEEWRTCRKAWDPGCDPDRMETLCPFDADNALIAFAMGDEYSRYAVPGIRSMSPSGLTMALPCRHCEESCKKYE